MWNKIDWDKVCFLDASDDDNKSYDQCNFPVESGTYLAIHYGEYVIVNFISESDCGPLFYLENEHEITPSWWMEIPSKPE